MHAVHSWVAFQSAVFFAVNRLCVLGLICTPALLILLFPLGYRMDALVAELIEGLGYPHRVNRAIEMAILAQLEAVEEKQQLRRCEEEVFLCYDLGEELGLLLVQRTFGVGVNNEVEDLRKQPCCREAISVGLPQDRQRWRAVEVCLVAHASHGNLRAGVEFRHELATAAVVLPHEHRLLQDVGRQLLRNHERVARVLPVSGR